MHATLILRISTAYNQGLMNHAICLPSTYIFYDYDYTLGTYLGTYLGSLIGIRIINKINETFLIHGSISKVSSRVKAKTKQIPRPYQFIAPNPILASCSNCNPAHPIHVHRFPPNPIAPRHTHTPTPTPAERSATCISH